MNVAVALNIFFLISVWIIVQQALTRVLLLHLLLRAPILRYAQPALQIAILAFHQLNVFVVTRDSISIMERAMWIAQQLLLRMRLLSV